MPSWTKYETYCDAEGFSIKYQEREDTLDEQGGGDCISKNTNALYEMCNKFGYNNFSLGIYVGVITEENHPYVNMGYPIGDKIIHVFIHNLKNNIYIDKSQGSHSMVNYDDMVESRQSLYRGNVEFLSLPVSTISACLGRNIDLIELRTIANFLMIGFRDEGISMEECYDIDYKELLKTLIPIMYREDNKGLLKELVKETKRVGKINVYQRYKKYLK